MRTSTCIAPCCARTAWLLTFLASLLSPLATAAAGVTIDVNQEALVCQPRQTLECYVAADELPGQGDQLLRCRARIVHLRTGDVYWTELQERKLEVAQTIARFEPFQAKCPSQFGAYDLQIAVEMRHATSTWEQVHVERLPLLVKDPTGEASADVVRLHAELSDVRRRINALAIRHAAESIADPGFEHSNLVDEINWQIQTVEHGGARIDDTLAHSGTRSLQLHSEATVSPASPVSVRSAPLRVAPTRRLAVMAWMRSVDDAPAPSVQLVVDGKFEGQTFSHHVDLARCAAGVGTTQPGGQWTPVVLQLDDLPRQGISDLRVGVDLRGPGQVWVDDIRIADMWLSDTEHRELHAECDQALIDLGDGRTDAVRDFVQHGLPARLAQWVPATERPQTTAPPAAVVTTVPAATSESPADSPAIAVNADPTSTTPADAKEPIAQEPEAPSVQVADTTLVAEDVSAPSDAAMEYDLPITPIVATTPAAKFLEVAEAEAGNAAEVAAAAIADAEKVAAGNQPEQADPSTRRWWQFWEPKPEQGNHPAASTTATRWRRAPRVSDVNRQNEQPVARSQQANGTPNEAFSMPRDAIVSMWNRVRSPAPDGTDLSEESVLKAERRVAARPADSPVRERRFSWLPDFRGRAKKDEVSADHDPDDAAADEETDYAQRWRARFGHLVRYPRTNETATVIPAADANDIAAAGRGQDPFPARSGQVLGYLTNLGRATAEPNAAELADAGKLRLFGVGPQAKETSPEPAQQATLATAEVKTADVDDDNRPAWIKHLQAALPGQSTVVR